MKTLLITLFLQTTPIAYDPMWFEKAQLLTQTKWGEFVMRPIC